MLRNLKSKLGSMFDIHADDVLFGLKSNVYGPMKVDDALVRLRYLGNLNGMSKVLGKKLGFKICFSIVYYDSLERNQ